MQKLRASLYIIIPCVAFILILLNAFFGHLLYESPYGQDINKYSIYIHLQSGWESYPRNILFEITNVWSNLKPESKSNTFYYDPSISPSLVNDRNYNKLQFQDQKPFVELKHEFSDCETSWKPILYRHAIDSIRNNIEYMQGRQLNNDPYVQIFPNISNSEYNSEKQKELIKKSFAQFIPICTASIRTSYEFSVSLNDKNIGFDVYFVPSKTQLDRFLQNQNFEFYPENGCFATNMQSFSGICNNVTSNSGLLILIPDELDLSVTKIKINLHEKI